MKLTIFNGSPRGKNSNSAILAKWIMEGADIECEEVYLAKIKEHELYAQKFAESDIDLLIFPLYTDSMPGITAAFIEELQPYAGRMEGKKLGFIVHSGFPEAYHSRHIERYLIRLAEKLGADYIGTAVMGSSEGTRLTPESYQNKKRERFKRLGESMIKNGAFDVTTLGELARPEKIKGAELTLYKTAQRLGILSMYFKILLKKNNVHKSSFARPYANE